MATKQNLRVVHLMDVPEALPVLAQWFVEEWTPWYGSEGPGEAEADLAACRRRDRLPLCLVALGQDGEVLGTAALRAESVGSELGVGPWLAGLLVGKDHRGQGLEATLIDAIVAEAKGLGFAAIYTSTRPRESLTRGGVWREVGASESLKGPVTVYRRQIGERT